MANFTLQKTKHPDISISVMGKSRGQEVEIFRQTAANFQQRRLWVLKISILQVNFHKVTVFQGRILYFFAKKIFPQLKFVGGGQGGQLPPSPCHDTNGYIKWWTLSTNAVLSTGGAEMVGLAGDAATCLLADSS